MAGEARTPLTETGSAVAVDNVILMPSQATTFTIDEDAKFYDDGGIDGKISSKLNGEVKKAEFRALRDTINVRPNEELTLRMKQDFIGHRMYHCHILEHEDLGMMGNLEVNE